MSVPSVIGYDTISQNYNTLPANHQVLAGYDTQVGGGTGFIAWTAGQYALAAATSKYPPLHIGQLPMGDPDTIDYLDIESGAATDGTLAAWARGAIAAWKAGTRPGQRQPAAYVEGSEVTGAVNALLSVGITSFPLILTKPMSLGSAQSILDTTGGPFPFVGVQFGFNGPYDTNLFSLAWLTSGKAVPPPPVQWNEVKFDMKLPTISQANPGPDPAYVQVLQSTLNEKAVGGGATRLTCDGSFGAETTGRLEQFQGNHNLTVDGVAGPLTWSAVTASP